MFLKAYDSLGRRFLVVFLLILFVLIVFLVIPMKSAGRSDSNRPLVPIQIGRPF